MSWVILTKAIEFKHIRKGAYKVRNVYLDCSQPISLNKYIGTVRKPFYLKLADRRFVTYLSKPFAEPSTRKSSTFNLECFLFQASVMIL